MPKSLMLITWKASTERPHVHGLIGSKAEELPWRKRSFNMKSDAEALRAAQVRTFSATKGVSSSSSSSPENKGKSEDNSSRLINISMASTRRMFDRYDNVRTRNNSHKLIKRTFTTSQDLNFFQSKLPQTWNQLPENIISAGIVNTFKNRLDKFWGRNPQFCTVLIPNHSYLWVCV
ncbi:hypothetical protein FHG87_025443 [Trinorchestia longiramus]|nr:hypothetical protein FHG87_025443 [Trinorchestia longiramus]